VLLDRLAEFQSTGHEAAVQQALALLAGLSQVESADIDTRAANHKVGTILQVIRDLAEQLKAGGPAPDSGALHQIARDALRTEYHPKTP
jgi:hypothetical protein